MKLAELFGVSKLVIGLTVVAFGTSAPELVVSLQAGLAGNPDIAIGNVVGSNILNILFILGIAALIFPLVVHRQIVRLEVPVMILISFVFWVFARDLKISALEVFILLASLVSFTVWTIRRSRALERASRADESKVPMSLKSLGLNSLGCFIGFGLLIFGARLLVSGSIDIARWMGVSEAVIGLTIVAAGTSMPEVAASVMAAIRKHSDIAVANVVGSNIFNILGILGISSMVSPGGLAIAPSIFAFDLPVMLAVAVASLPIFFTGFKIQRVEALLFLVLYGAYLAFLILASQQHQALDEYSWVMGTFVLPLLALGILTSVFIAFKQGKTHSE